jgi:RNA polymerase sigma-70 factor (ECF subfamily)
MPHVKPAREAIKTPETGDVFETTLREQRPRLVALCASMTGDRRIAEDLAQETLIEAWRHWHDIRDGARRGAWLAGIAHNVCRRWAHSQGRAKARQIEPMADDARMPDEDGDFSDGFDLEIELERRELVELLDRALALLPAETREMLVARFVRELPISEIAGRLGVNTAAAAMRLQRGKLALRHMLMSAMRQEIAPYLLSETTHVWQETHIWCFVCGQRRLRGRLTGNATLILTCPDCAPDPNHPFFETCPEIWGEVKGYGRALTRTLDWVARYYQPALESRTIACYICGAVLPLYPLVPLHMAAGNGRQALGFQHRCPVCHAASTQPLAGLLLASQEGRRFRRDHPRMRILPEQEIEADGRTCVVTRFVSVDDQACLVFVAARDSGQVIHVI